MPCYSTGPIKNQIELIDTQHVRRKVDAHILADELCRVNAISHEEHILIGMLSAKTTNTFATNPNPKLTRLITKYKLPGPTQASLEKGLRMAANNGFADDLGVFLQYVHNVNATDPNPASQKSALHWATIKGHEDCRKLLIEHGAIPELSAATAAAAAAPEQEQRDAVSASVLSAGQLSVVSSQPILPAEVKLVSASNRK